MALVLAIRYPEDPVVWVKANSMENWLVIAGPLFDRVAIEFPDNVNTDWFVAYAIMSNWVGSMVVVGGGIVVVVVGTGVNNWLGEPVGNPI